MQSRQAILWLAAVITCGLLVSVPAAGSDNDERPAYMIYIDPETGKYTTEEPNRDKDAVNRKGPGANTKRSAIPKIVGGMLLALALIGYAVRKKGMYE